MGYDKGSSGWYLKSGRTQHATLASRSASTSASASAPVSAAAQSSSTQDLERYQARSSRGGDPMEISYAPPSADDNSDNDSTENEGDSEGERNQEDEANSEGEGNQEDEANTEEEG
ncbi:uncharacterized protein LOC131162678 [Malania oleifera]|uniref:uncharacterized protein LOC131162678 n=1 Tax=Malania oleifera TaxID=397392 RepID=UPI0025AE5F71|nr:uncharacterized protein LOC131162678 [Malania oleifera]